jgi:hypothetical protein
MHAAMKEASAELRQAPLLRIAGAFSAIAASLLIISSAWLLELKGNSPTASPVPVAQGVSAFPQGWEQVAMGAYVPPARLERDRGFSPFEPALAYNDREFANDIFVGLSH